MVSAANGYPTSQVFDPALHLAPCPGKPGVLRAYELGYPSVADSDVIATKPFPLFTAEAICRIRAEIFDHETLANHLHSDSNNPCTVRGACPQRAPFTYAAWTHPTVLERVNSFASVPITLMYDYEIGSTNIQLGPRGWAGLKAEPDLPGSTGELCAQDEVEPTLMATPNWHRDSYPYVCVLMLSESSHIQGGRTVIRKADGSNYFCEMPHIGHAIILRGGNTLHAISPTDTTQERISMVTSFRLADPLAKDEAVLNTVRTTSHVPTLHKQWCQYRLRVLAKRAEALALKMDDPSSTTCVEDQMINFVKEQEDFLSNTVGEMINPVSVVRTNVRKTFLAWKASHETSSAIN